MNNPFPAVLSKYSGPIITHRMYDNKLGTTNIPYSHLGTQMGGHSLPESCTGLNFQLQCTSVWFNQACSLAPTHLTTFSSQTYLPPRPVYKCLREDWTWSRNTLSATTGRRSISSFDLHKSSNNTMYKYPIRSNSPGIKTFSKAWKYLQQNDLKI